MRKEPLVTGEIYHIFNKSIAGYQIFNFHENARRFLLILDYYNTIQTLHKLSYTLQYSNDLLEEEEINLLLPKQDALIKVICYCIMPTHYHLVVKVINEEQIYRFLNIVGIAYTRYFNTRHKRKGPLWQSSYQAVRVRSNEQLLHLTRYVHINPTTSKLVERPEDWELSSYRDYINDPKLLRDTMTEISIRTPEEYKKFCESRIDYQRRLKLIKDLLLE